MKAFKIFVYGTLMKGYRNYDKYLDGHINSIKSAYVHGKMYHLPEEECPAIVEGNERVYGQVMEGLDDDKGTILNSVDVLEKYFGNNSSVMYERRKKEVFYEDGTSEMLDMYIFVNNDYLEAHDSIYIEDGDWDSFKKAI